MASNNSSNSSNPPPQKNPNDDGSSNNNNNNQNTNSNPRNRSVEIFATTQQVAELVRNSVVLPNSQCVKNRVYYSPMPNHPELSEVTVLQVMKHNLLVHTYATYMILGHSNNPNASTVPNFPTAAAGNNNQPLSNTYQNQHLPPMYRNPSSSVPPAPRFNNRGPSTITINPFIPNNINGPTIQPQIYNNIPTPKGDRTILNPKPLNMFMPPSTTNNGAPFQNPKDDHRDYHNCSLDQNRHLPTDENPGENNNTDSNALYLLTYEMNNEASKEVNVEFLKSSKDDMSDEDDGVKKEMNKRRQVEKGKKKITSN